MQQVWESQNFHLPNSFVYHGVRIGTWCAQQRVLYAQKRLTTDRINALESLPNWLWVLREDHDTLWVEWIDLLK